MPALVLLGAQWGDEGKGKATDLLGGSVDYVVRYQGGNNAGHTVVVGDQKGRVGYGMSVWHVDGNTRTSLDVRAGSPAKYLPSAKWRKRGSERS